MSVPASKSDLLAAISTTFDKLMLALEQVPQDLAREKSLEGHAAGTKISPADLVAYLLGWNSLVLKWLDRDDRGEEVDFPETAFKWNQLGMLAQKFYADYNSLEWPELLASLRSTNAQLISTISLRLDEELYGRPWHGKWTKGRMIQFNTSSPYSNAQGRVRRWLRDRY